MIRPDFKIYAKEGVDLKSLSGSSVIALGTFDGVHIAHKQLIEEAKMLAKRIFADSVGVFCFSESPAKVLSGRNIPQLSSNEEKTALLLSLGLDFVAVGDFRDFCDLGAEDFIEETLKGDLKCIGTACGFNHHFGHKGLGNSELLKKSFGQDNTVTFPEVRLFSETVSSSAIRAHILEGNISQAALMLGRQFSLSEKVVEGKALGRDLGFPTANQFFPKDKITPRRGIYATLCTTEDGKRHIGVSNVGVRPTIVDGSDSHITNCETFLYNFSSDIYGQRLTVEFHEFLRDEKKFSSIAELKEQIGRDLSSSLNYFSKTEYKDLI